MKDITKESLVDLFYKLFVEENKVPSYYLDFDPNCENIESKHEGISDDLVWRFYELVGVDYWEVTSGTEIIPIEIQKHLEKQTKIIDEIIKNFNADKNFYDFSIPKYANLFLKQLEYLQNRIVW
jgi:hypothetical protein